LSELRQEGGKSEHNRRDVRANVGKTKIAARSPEIRRKDAKKNVEKVNARLLIVSAGKKPWHRLLLPAC
jgi:hypothetical protein